MSEDHVLTSACADNCVHGHSEPSAIRMKHKHISQVQCSEWNAVHRIPDGLDRSWEAKRVEGLEMLGHSVEAQKEKQRSQKASAATQDHVHKNQIRGKKQHTSAKPDRQAMGSGTNGMVTGGGHSGGGHRQLVLAEINQNPNARLEQQIKDLSEQLLIEKQQSRQDRLNLAKFQQQLARTKSERPVREMLTKELEQERRKREEIELHLKELSIHCCNCKTEVLGLQKENARMKELVQSLAPYKSKLERLKHDSVTAAVGLETELHKLKSQVVSLEQDNALLDAEVHKLESIMSRCSHCHQQINSQMKLGNTTNSDAESDKIKMLLERLRILESDKSSLVLENEALTQQYERYLDKIAKQVLTALMSQKSLREECSELRSRVDDLNRQNSHLRKIFHEQQTEQHSKLQSSPRLKEDGDQSYVKNDAMNVAIDGLGMSLNSLNSIYSEQDQMQNMQSRLCSPFGEFRDIFFPNDSAASSCIAAAISSTSTDFFLSPASQNVGNYGVGSSYHGKPTNASDKLLSSAAGGRDIGDVEGDVAESEPLSSRNRLESSSTVSLNELLDLALDDMPNDTDKDNDKVMIRDSWADEGRWNGQVPEHARSSSYLVKFTDSLEMPQQDNRQSIYLQNGNILVSNNNKGDVARSADALFMPNECGYRRFVDIPVGNDLFGRNEGNNNGTHAQFSSRTTVCSEFDARGDSLLKSIDSAIQSSSASSSTKDGSVVPEDDGYYSNPVHLLHDSYSGDVTNFSQ